MSHIRPFVLRTLTTSHCIPEEPTASPRSTAPSLSYSVDSIESNRSDDLEEQIRPRRASTKLISQNAADVQRIIGAPGTRLIENCCGGGCCMALTKTDGLNYEQVTLPDNAAYRALDLKIGLIPTTFSGLAEIPPKTVEFLPLNATLSKTSTSIPPIPSPADSAISVTSPTEAPVEAEELVAPTEKQRSMSIDFTPHPDVEKGFEEIDTRVHPPNFVQPHPPFHVYSAKIFNARELTRPGAEKRTYHFDLDVTDYPEETGVDFKVGGAIGAMVPNQHEMVENIFDLLCIPRHVRDRPVLLKTSNGRWPTVWGDDKAREITTTRRALLTWCSDIQSYPPTKPLLRLLAEYASNPAEKKILLYLCSAEGQGTFCDFRTGPHVTINQLLTAFPSSKPPLDALLSQLQTLMPRFYSLSNDPHESCVPANGCTRLIEIAVTVHESPTFNSELHPYGQRTGVGSGFFERQAHAFIDAEARGEKVDLRIPMFKGLMANPLARQFVSDGPMLLIGAGVGVAPFRGFVQRRLKNANCANKVWVLQGIRDSLLDELYTGEWGVHEDEVKKVVQSRKPSGGATDDGKPVGKYVQDEVKQQADLVWFIINSLDGRVFVCGSTKGMGEGVEEALVEVAMKKGNLGREDAQEFWNIKKEGGQYIAETW